MVRVGYVWVLVLLVGTCAWARPQLPPVVGQDVIHVVQPQEATESIAHEAGLALEHVAFANGIAIGGYVPEVAAGVPLVLPERRILPLDPPRDGIVLNIPERGLFLFRHGQFVKFYPVAFGRPHFETPVGQFRIIEKTKNPTWVPPAWAHLTQKVYLPGPINPLGDRWIGLSAHGVGIHGTTCPDAIGMNVSHGCIRMYPDLERLLYNQVDVGMPVRIEYQPVKVGRDPVTGRVYVAVYPDVYGRVNLEDRTRELLREAGIQVPAERLTAWVDQESGRAMDVASDPIVVKADDLDVASNVAPMRRAGTLWVSLDVMRQAGFSVDTTDSAVSLQWQDHTAQLPITNGPPSSAESACVWKGMTWVPAPSVLKTLGVQYRWLPSSATLWIRPEDTPAAQN
ncbi:MAG TPA: L,D-transpeptidase [Candidatus Xenobia bacterium]